MSFPILENFWILGGEVLDFNAEHPTMVRLTLKILQHLL